MNRAWAVLWLLWLPPVLRGQGGATVAMPSYRAESIANLADGRPEVLAPNSLVLVTGKNLSDGVRSRPSQASGGVLPVSLAGAQTTVLVNGLMASIEYASPEAVVFVMPPNLRPGNVDIRIGRSSWYGPSVRKVLKPEAPALFARQDCWLLARHAADGTWIDEISPARPGETVMLYGTGLGDTNPPQVYRQAPKQEADLAAASALLLRVNGVALEPDRVLYAGASPGNPGLYEIRVRLPEVVEEDPEVLLSIGGGDSSPGLRLNLRQGLPQPDAGPPRLKQ
jgi:uncharacterized protein (TIGR03437 family)